MLRRKEKMGFHGGFNLLDTYPLKFCNIIEEIQSDRTPEKFEFHFPDQKIRHVIVNLCPTEPWALPNWVVLGHKTTAFLDKLYEMKTRYFPEASVSIAINKRETEFVAKAIGYANAADWIKIYTLDPKYPQDDPVMFAKVILGLDINFGQNITTQGIFIFDAQTLLAIYDTCILKNTVNSRLITLSGSGLKENEIVRVRLGTSIDTLLQHRTQEAIKYNIFVNGPLRGREITDISQKIDWSVNNIVVLKDQDSKVIFPMLKSDELAFTTNILGEPRQCVYCNFCDNICPVELEPALYYHSYIRGEKHKARLYHLEKCIECGLCSFICPSKLELLRINKECKALDRKT
ncbi:MAG: 4Fe-4S dicluster domain-containing protein [wastewater metagenome]|nr:4Fe-4S dicluster domain-containing protein [Candidatus Loosdrechtia aerotolerans]